MTISYTGKVANARLCGFIKLLLYWKGSIYKLMYKEMLIFVTLYYIISAAYRLALKEEQKRVFEKVVLHCQTFIDLIPLSFVLGFYVAIVVGRWWNQFMSIPWPDRLMIYVSTLVQGADERGRIIRRTLMRYLSLSSVMTFQIVSLVAKKRFPTYAHMLEAGLLTESEIKVIEDLPSQHPKYWVPIMWASTLLMQARKEGRISDDISLKTLLDEVNSYRNGLGSLMMYDWISVPLVYTQVTTLAVYSFFFGSLFGRQFLDPNQGYQGHEVDMYVPIFTLLQFFFYMGWIKVAEQLINPFGDDEDDFETNFIIDRNLQISLLAVDEMYDNLPTLEKDAFWDELEPILPHTIASVDHKTKSYLGSTADISLSGDDMKVVTPMETIPEVAIHHDRHLISSQINMRSSPTSPIHQRRLYQNMFGSLQVPLNHLSTLDGLKGNIEGTPKKANVKPLVQTLQGPEVISGSAPTTSYVQHWLDKRMGEERLSLHRHSDGEQKGSVENRFSVHRNSTGEQSGITENRFPAQLNDGEEQNGTGDNRFSFHKNAGEQCGTPYFERKENIVIGEGEADLEKKEDVHVVEIVASPTLHSMPSFTVPDPENPSMVVEYVVECEGNQSTVSSTTPLLQEDQDWHVAETEPAVDPEQHALI